jgi:hypothetical protein|tara:strand:- start:162 stop:338 length:177 start_codon:yes stop_codon:yes gene_type:complete
MVKTEYLTIFEDYKKGGLTLDEAANKLSKASGLRLDVAKEYMKKLKKDNIVLFKEYKK